MEIVVHYLAKQGNPNQKIAFIWFPCLSGFLVFLVFWFFCVICDKFVAVKPHRNYIVLLYRFDGGGHGP